METILDWLLHNVGKEGNHLTVLDIKPQKEDNSVLSLDVVARTKKFDVVDIHIIRSSKSEASQESASEEKHTFGNAGQVIAYLSDGNLSDTSIADEEDIFSVSIMQPQSTH